MNIFETFGLSKIVGQPREQMKNFFIDLDVTRREKDSDACKQRVSTSLIGVQASAGKQTNVAEVSLPQSGKQRDSQIPRT